MQKAHFQGRTYLHPMIAETQRRVAVDCKALRLMQEHHDNPYFSFKCVNATEEKEWRAQAEAMIEPVIVEPEPELAAAYQRIAELEAVLVRVREAIDDPRSSPCSCASEGLLNDIDAAISEQVQQ